MYFNGVHVRHNANRPARAEKAHKGSLRGGAGSRRLYLALSSLVVGSRAFSRSRAVPSAPASVKALRFAPPAAAALRGLD
jgi:hypothetical protein